MDLGDPRESLISFETPATWEADNRLEERWQWGAQLLDLCNLPPKEYKDSTIVMCKIVNSGSPVPPTPPGHDYSKDYLTFKALSDGVLRWGYDYYGEEDPYEGLAIEYRKNNGEWTTIIPTQYEFDESFVTITGGGSSINVVSGDVIEFRGDYQAYGDDWNTFQHLFNGTANFNLMGNIMSMVNSTGYPAETVLQSAFTFGYLFEYVPGLTDASNLVLPATTLTEGCYTFMFYGCTSLTTATELPAPTLAEHCYGEMFAGCTSLTTAPELPATTLTEGCYWSMFAGCTSLTTAPELPATTLASSCYYYMFAGCTNLTTAPELPATTLVYGCYGYMFDYCTSLTTAPELPATTLAEYCYQSMFYGCTSLTTAPELPATTLTPDCYRQMFYNCTSLNYIKCLATDISAVGCTNGWVGGVASAGTFVKNSNMSSWTTGVNGIPNGWTVQDAS